MQSSDSDSKGNSMIRCITSLWLVGVMLCTIVACDRSRGKAQAILLILPNGYRGVVTIEGDRADGVRFSEDEVGRLVLRISQNGVVRLRGQNPLFDWHQLTVLYEDGVQVPVDDPPADAVAFRYLGTGGDPSTVTYGFVGTADEARAAQLARYGIAATSQPVR